MGPTSTTRSCTSWASAPPADEWPAANLISSGRAAVREGQYWARINTFNWPPGAVRVLVQFPLPPQPPEVDARYGPLGEYLAGDNVVALGGYARGRGGAPL